MREFQVFFKKFQIKLSRDAKQKLMLVICLMEMFKNVFKILLMLLNVEKDGDKSTKIMLK